MVSTNCLHEYQWTEEICIDLIREFRKRRILWDRTHKLYSRKLSKKKLWTEIGEAMDIPGHLCKQKMTILMSSFRREKYKFKHSLRDDPSKVYKSLWFAFKEMSFLMDEETEMEMEHFNIKIQKDKKKRKKNRLESVFAKERAIMLNNSSSDDEMGNPQSSGSDAVAATPVPGASTSEEEIKSYTNFIAMKMRKYTEKTKNAVQAAICEIIFKADQNFYETGYVDVTIPPQVESPRFETTPEVAPEANCTPLIITQDFDDSEEEEDDSE